jgi:N,N'-diacetyllegionaminate synthase
MVTRIEIGRRAVGKGAPCFVIAEAGVNHNGDLAVARQLIEAAAAAGADAVKFQSFKADRLVTAHAPKAEYQKKAGGETETQREMLRRLELTPEMHLDLMRYSAERGVLFLSSPFDEISADELLSLGLGLLKLPSGEITNLPFLAHVARKKVPVILSTGMSSLEEVEQAVDVFRMAGNSQVVLLHCVSDYPADPADCNLRAMRTMEEAFGLPVGFSDHTKGIEIALAAVALGACAIEKHFTLDRSFPGPDHQASLEPDQLATMVRGIRQVEAAVGDGAKVPTAAERKTAEVARKSIVADCNIPANCLITPQMLAMRRPGIGLPSTMLGDVAGRRARIAIPAGTLIDFEMLK